MRWRQCKKKNVITSVKGLSKWKKTSQGGSASQETITFIHCWNNNKSKPLIRLATPSQTGTTERFLGHVMEVSCLPKVRLMTWR